MGCDIHAVLQRKQKDNTWITIATDLFGRDYRLFGYLSGVRHIGGEAIAHEGFPDDFETNRINGSLRHGKFCMGEHSYGHCTLEEFCAYEIKQEEPADSYFIKKEGNTISITFNPPDDEDFGVKALQAGFRNLFFDLENYRLVFGYDS